MITCALIYGFDSPEHDVSVMTALEIIRNAPSIGVRLKPIYARDGHFYGGDELTEVAAYTPFDRTAHREVLISGGKLWQIKRGKAKIECDLDVALIAAHGGEGENGALQGFLEIAGIPYFSTGVFGSALGMNKAATKTLLSAKGVPVSEWVTLKRGEDHREIFESIAYPVIIKPNSGGSSLGIYVADSAAEAVGMTAKAFECDPDFDELIVEKYLVGADDINVAVIAGGDKIVLSAPERPLKKGNILSFADKYAPENGKISEFPAKINDAVSEKLKKYAEIGVKALNIRGVARFDFLVRGEEVYFNEVNTVPGSLAFYLFPNYSHTEFIKMLITEGVNLPEKQANRHAGTQLLNIKPKRLGR